MALLAKKERVYEPQKMLRNTCATSRLLPHKFLMLWRYLGHSVEAEHLKLALEMIVCPTNLNGDASVKHPRPTFPI